MRNRIATFLASACYIGYIPGAPGTYASIATTLAFYFVYRINNRILPELHLSVICLVTLAGVLAANQVSKALGDEDPSLVVIDEVAGQLLTFLFVPVHFWNLVLGTLLFRIYDVLKPFPVRNLESLKNGVGVMADDLAAGIYAGVCLHLINRLLHW